MKANGEKRPLCEACGRTHGSVNEEFDCLRRELRCTRAQYVKAKESLEYIGTQIRRLADHARTV